jgi:hypothetical protein
MKLSNPIRFIGENPDWCIPLKTLSVKQVRSLRIGDSLSDPCAPKHLGVTNAAVCLLLDTAPSNQSEMGQIKVQYLGTGEVKWLFRAWCDFETVFEEV